MLPSAHSDLRIDLSSSRLGRPFYTTLDKITGRLIYAPQSPMDVHDIVVDFLGISKTWIDPSIPGSARKKAFTQVLIPNPILSANLLIWLVVFENE